MAVTELPWGTVARRAMARPSVCRFIIHGTRPGSWWMARPGRPASGAPLSSTAPASSAAAIWSIFY